jgi:integrase
MPEHHEAMVWVAALTGLRWGEVAGLTAGQLNLGGPFTVTVDRQVGRDEHGRPIVEDPKSEAGTRTLSIPIALRAVLAEHLARTGLTTADSERLLFAAPDGGLLRYSEWRRDAWVPAALAAGYSREVADARRPGRTRTEPTIGFHDLRRMNATEMIRLNVDVKTAQHRLGHADPRLTLALYAEATTEADLEAADRLGVDCSRRPETLSRIGGTAECDRTVATLRGRRQRPFSFVPSRGSRASVLVQGGPLKSHAPL